MIFHTIYQTIQRYLKSIIGNQKEVLKKQIEIKSNKSISDLRNDIDRYHINLKQTDQQMH